MSAESVGRGSGVFVAFFVPGFVTLLVLSLVFVADLNLELRAGENFSKQEGVNNPLLGGGVQFAGVAVEFQGVVLSILDREETSAEEAPLDVANLGPKRKLVVDSLEIDTEVGVESFGFFSNSGDLEIIERGDEVAKLVGIDFLCGIVETLEFPLVGEVFSREFVDLLIDSLSLLFIKGVPVDDQVGDVVALDVEQIGFNPVGELCREIHLAFGNVNIVVLGVSHVVPIGGVLATGGFDLFADDVVDQCGAFAVTDCDPASESFAEAGGRVGVEHTVLLVVAVGPEFVAWFEVGPLDSVERGGGLGQAVLGVGLVVVVSRNHVPSGGLILHDPELAGCGLPLGEDDHFQFSRVIDRVEVIVEGCAQVLGLLAGGYSSGIDGDGQRGADNGRGGEAERVSGFGIHVGIPQPASDETVPERDPVVRLRSSGILVVSFLIRMTRKKIPSRMAGNGGNRIPSHL